MLPNYLESNFAFTFSTLKARVSFVVELRISSSGAFSFPFRAGY